MPDSSTVHRLGVPRSVKLFFGDWRRPESGRTCDVAGVRVPLSTRKDLRDAVRVARSAQSGWAAKTAYNRGQILYRFAEMCDARRDQIAADVVAAMPPASVRESSTRFIAALEATDAFVDRVVYWAGMCDKAHQLLGAVNPVAAPFSSVSAPTPGGVVAVFPEAATPLDALASYADAVCAPLAMGCAVIVTLPPEAYLGLLSLTESWGTADLPAGTVCQLSATGTEVPLTAAAHSGLDAIDVSGLDDDTQTECLTRAADALTRVRHSTSRTDALSRMRFASELRTVWTPGAI